MKMPPYLTSTVLAFFGGRFCDTSVGRFRRGRTFMQNIDREALEWVRHLLEINHPWWDSKFFEGFHEF
jgi:hypothetical protein